MTWRNTLSVPLFSAALTITVPAMAQQEAETTDSNRPGERSTQQTPAPGTSTADTEASATSQTTEPPSSESASESSAAVSSQQPSLKQASELMDVSVRNHQGQVLGHLSDIVVDPQSNDIKYAVLTTGETLGVGGRMHAVPWQALSPGQDEQVLMLQFSQEQISQMEGFDDDAWPDAGNYAFLGEDPGESSQQSPQPQPQQRQAPHSQSQSQQQESASQDQRQAAAPADGDDQATAGPDERTGLESEEAATLAQQRVRRQALQQDTVITPLDRENLWSHRVSKLIGLDVRDGQNEQIGTLDDLVLEARRGKIAYAIVAYGGTLGIGDNRAIVPWGALQLDKQEQVASLDTDRETLDQVAFEGEEMPDMTDQRWVNRTHQAFGQQPDAEVFGYPIDANQADEQGQREAPSQQQRPSSQGENQGQSAPRGDRSRQQPTTPSSRDVERDDQAPVDEPTTPSAGEMQSQ